MAKILNSSKLLPRIPDRSRIEELTAKQLITSRTDYDSITNPKIYQFVAIRGISGLCSPTEPKTTLYRAGCCSRVKSDCRNVHGFYVTLGQGLCGIRVSGELSRKTAGGCRL